MLNLKEIVPDISHEMYCQATAGAFRQKWQGRAVNERLLTVSELEKVPKLMQIYEASKKWEWRFGETPSFTNQIETKLDWAMLDIEFQVEKGVIKGGVCYSDCLVPAFIDELNAILKEEQGITYDEQGMQRIGLLLAERCPQDNDIIQGKYIPELVRWMKHAI